MMKNMMINVIKNVMKSMMIKKLVTMTDHVVATNQLLVSKSVIKNEKSNFYLSWIFLFFMTSWFIFLYFF